MIDPLTKGHRRRGRIGEIGRDFTSATNRGSKKQQRKASRLAAAILVAEGREELDALLAAREEDQAAIRKVVHVATDGTITGHVPVQYGLHNFVRERCCA